jgi:universal stress protein F
MYKSILIPIDMLATDRAKDMFAAAKALRDNDGTITCLHVVPDIPASVSMEIPVEIRPRLMASARETIQSAADAAGLTVTIEIDAGHAARTILDVAEKIKTDLIIVGSHEPGLEDYLLGSTASRVVRHAKCNVLVQR